MSYLDALLNGREAVTLTPGPLASIPSASSVAAGTLFFPTDDSYQYVSTGVRWNLINPYSRLCESPGDLTSWTYTSGTVGYAALQSRGQYTRMVGLASNSVPDYVVWLPPAPQIVTGPGGVWSITACMRFTDRSYGNSNELYSSCNIALLDDVGHMFQFGPQLTGSFFANAHTCGFSGHTRTAFSELETKEFSQLTPALSTYWVRVRFDGTDYHTEYSQTGYQWFTGTNGVGTSGGHNVLKWGTNSGDIITPSRYALGTQFIPNTQRLWDVLQFRVSPTAD